MFMTMFDSNWLKTTTLAVSRVGCGLNCPGSRVTLLLGAAASGRASDKGAVI